MRPRLAICSTLLDADGAVESLLASDGGPAVEFRIDAHRVSEIVTDVDAVLCRLPVDRRESTEVRYHFPIGHFELSHVDDDLARQALALMQTAVGHIARSGGSYLTVHLALPEDGMGERFVRACDLLGELVEYGGARGVRVCLENLRWGVTSKPELFLELVDASGSGVTFDVGHAVSSDAATEFPATRFAQELGDLIENVHVYGREESVHLPPASISEIAPVVDALLATRCSWWTVELFSLSDFTSTRDMLLSYFDSVHLGLRNHQQPIL